MDSYPASKLQDPKFRLYVRSTEVVHPYTQLLKPPVPESPVPGLFESFEAGPALTGIVLEWLATAFLRAAAKMC